MGWAAKYGKRYRAMYRDADGKMCSAGIHDRKRDAEDAANEAEAKARGDLKEVLTWAEWKTEWWQTRTVQPSTLARDERAINTHIMPRWGDVLLPDISRHDVQLWVTALSGGKKPLQPTTVAKTFRIFSGSMRAAVVADLIPSSPCEGIKLPKAGPTPDRFLSNAECEAIRKYLDDEWVILFDLLLGTGMRFGEGLALHWENVNLESGTIEVRWSFDRVARVVKAPKNNTSRTVPLSDELKTVLVRRLKDNGFGTPPDVEYVGSSKPHTGLVVGSLNERSWVYAWRAALKVAKVDGRPVTARAHDLRHTYASRLVQDGVDLLTVGNLLGHSAPTVTARYARVADTRWGDVRRSLNG